MKVLVVTSGWPSEDRPEQSSFVAEQVERLREMGLSVEVVSFEGRMNPMNYERARLDLRRRLRDSAFDLVHAHFGQTGLVVWPCSVPVVVTFYGSDLLGVVGASGRYTARGWILRRISRWVAGRADQVVLLAERLAKRLPAHVGYEVVPLGVDMDVFRPTDIEQARAALGLALDRRFVLFAGDPSAPAKRFGLASRAVGIARQILDVELMTISRKSRREVARYLNAVDALLVTSRHEAGPLIAKEALACNTPVVSVDVGDVASLLSGLPGSYLCIDDAPDTIANALLDILRRKESFVGRHVVETFSQERMAKKLIAIYERLLTQR